MEHMAFGRQPASSCRLMVVVERLTVYNVFSSNMGIFITFSLLLTLCRASWPSRAVDAMFYVWHKPNELAHSFLFCSCVCFRLYDPFNCILFHKFSRQLSIFWLIFWSYLCLIKFGRKNWMKLLWYPTRFMTSDQSFRTNCWHFVIQEKKTLS